MSFPAPEIDDRPRKRNILLQVRRWNFHIDHYVNPYVPPSPLRHLPPWASRWFGYREGPVEDVGNILASFWAAIGAFAGLAVVAAVFNATPSIQERYSGVMIASFGASAILEYNTLASPLGQPRNAVLGHTFSAIVGVGVSKLFALNPLFPSSAAENVIDHPSNIQWIPPAVACALSSALMLLTGTVHPPGGASAVLAASDRGVKAMGWWFVLLVLWGSTLMVGVGLVINNLPVCGRRFPFWWWSPGHVGGGYRRRNHHKKQDVENGAGGARAIGVIQEFDDEEKVGIGQWGDVAESRGAEDAIAVLEGMELTEEEREMLGRMKWRLRRGYEGDDEKESEEGSMASSSSPKDSSKSVVIA